MPRPHRYDDHANHQCGDFFRNTRATMDKSWLRPRYPGFLSLADRGGNPVNAFVRGDLGEDAALAGAGKGDDGAGDGLYASLLKAKLWTVHVREMGTTANDLSGAGRVTRPLIDLRTVFN